MAKLTYKLTLYQGGVEATFRLTDKEAKHAKWIINKGHNYDFEWFAWADYEISRSKSIRFNRVFNYQKGDFCCPALEKIV